ncbi:MAG: SulP family inorganic anion transporter [Spirochaetes bacterium]|nr:SulP family inorganic anion transporter [Spirochaetota bacterium]
MKLRNTLFFLSRDFSGGLTAALVSLPGSIVYGMIAFAPLGEGYIFVGIQAAFYCTIICGLFSALFSSSKIMISGTEGPITLVFASLLQSVIIRNPTFAHIAYPQTVLSIVFVTVFFAGLLQIFFCIFRLGRIIKFIPYPVVSGFRNGTALLIIIKKIKKLAVSVFPKTSENISLQNVNFSIMFLILFIIIVIIFSKGISKKIPSILVGLIAGLIVFYILKWFHLPVGKTIGQAKFELIPPVYFIHFTQLFVDKDFYVILPSLIPAIISIALIGSLDTLLTAQSLENITDKRSASHQDLLGQGIGNLLSSLFGGLPGAGVPGRSFINHSGGGHSLWSGIFYSLTFFVIVFFVSPLMSYLSEMVMSGVIIGIALLIFDPWFLSLFKKLYQNKDFQTRNFINMILVLTVMLITVFFNIMIGVLTGIFLSMLQLIIRMSKSVVKRIYFGSTFHSKKERAPFVMDFLAKHGKVIGVMELEGFLFFGTADRLSLEIEGLVKKHSLSFVILDLKRIEEIDITGIQIILRIYRHLMKSKKRLLFSCIRQGESSWNVLNESHFFDEILEKHVFFDTNLALQWCEEIILAKLLPDYKSQQTLPLQEIKILEGLSLSDYQILNSYLEETTFTNDEKVFQQGDPPDALYFILKGNVDVEIDLPQGKTKKIITLTQGTIFGEMALLDGKSRSATIRISEPVIAYKLSMENFHFIKEKYPQIALVILTNISLLFSSHLRNANKIISELES